MSTAVICVILAIVVVIGVKSVIKRGKSGCCGGGDVPKKIKVDKNTSHYSHKYIVNIEGMHCSHCTAAVENALNSLGDVYARADLKKNNAEVYAKSEYTEAKLSDIINSCGFKASGVERVA